MVEEAFLSKDNGSPRDEQCEAVGLGHILDGVALAGMETHYLGRVTGGNQLLELQARHGHRLEHPLVRILQHGVEIYWPHQEQYVQELTAVEQHEGEVPREDVGIAVVKKIYRAIRAVWERILSTWMSHPRF